MEITGKDGRPTTGTPYMYPYQGSPNLDNPSDNTFLIISPALYGLDMSATHNLIMSDFVSMYHADQQLCSGVSFESITMRKTRVHDPARGHHVTDTS